MLSKLFLVSFACLTIVSWQCSRQTTTAGSNNSSGIQKITYSSMGGMAGHAESLSIAADSLHYSKALRGNERLLHEATTKQFWNELTGAVNLSDFDKIKSNPGHTLYDGIDVTIAIETGIKKHTIVNGNEDSAGYQKIAAFANLLERKLESLRQRLAE